MGSKLVNSPFKEDGQMADMKPPSDQSFDANKKSIKLRMDALKSILE